MNNSPKLEKVDGPNGGVQFAFTKEQIITLSKVVENGPLTVKDLTSEDLYISERLMSEKLVTIVMLKGIPSMCSTIFGFEIYRSVFDGKSMSAMQLSRIFQVGALG